MISLKLRLLSFIFILLFCGSCNLIAFEIQFKGEDSFYVGKPMVYVITGTAGDPNTIGLEGVYQFGPTLINIDNKIYHVCTFDTGSGYTIFYFRIDNANKLMTQKYYRFGETEIEISPEVVALKYPLYNGQKWDNKGEKTTITAKKVVIPGFGQFPGDLKIENINAQTTVTSTRITVPAGTFDSLLVEEVYTGSLLGIPATVVQRTWMSEDNVPLKRNFEFTKPTKLMIYEMELARPNPNIYDLNWDGVVNIIDLVFITKYYGSTLTSPRIPNPDVNGDNVVDLNDIKVMISRFGEKYK